MRRTQPKRVRSVALAGASVVSGAFPAGFPRKPSVSSTRKTTEKTPSITQNPWIGPGRSQRGFCQSHHADAIARPATESQA